jgi:ribosome-binding protein aMBF1 (putative translation factor)
VKKSKKTLLEKRGWKVGSAEEFLELGPEEVALVEMKLALSEGLRERRRKQGLTQNDLARMLESSQSRVAKMEAADPSVSLDLLVRALLTLGASRREIARVMSTSSKAA